MKLLNENMLLKINKPARYTGGELGSTYKNLDDVDVRFAFCFPDVYEVGMSHLGIKILYSVLNEMPYVWCERVFAPWDDMQALMKKENIPLFSLESETPVSEFDFIGFTLQYELSFTAVINMLHLAGLKPFQKDRGNELKNIVIGGGPCVCNPEPVADFFDLISLGEGEEQLPEVMELYRECKKKGLKKDKFLRLCKDIDGLYVPSLYDVSYNSDGTIKEFSPKDDAPKKIRKRLIENLSEVHYPKTFPVPFIEPIHDRAVVEIMRGCVRGCRFCQAGFIGRPLREKNEQVLLSDAKCLCDSTGYDELSLISLSSSDYTRLEPLLEELLKYTEKNHISISLPSLRIDNFSKELLDRIASVRKSSLTFAPEAGSQRLRDVINKNITFENIENTCKIAFEGGYTAVKLYFMMGLPTETDEDIVAIADLAQQIVDLYYSLPTKPKGKSVSVSISVATFVPKPFTPFQWEPQDVEADIERKQKLLVSSVRSKKISVSWHDSKTSLIEAALARGDRRISAVLYKAWEKGCFLDGWGEFFKPENYMEAFRECSLDPAFYANRLRSEDEILPWDHLDYMVSKNFLLREKHMAYEGKTTPNCFEKCSGCGAATCKGDKVCDKHKN